MVCLSHITIQKDRFFSKASDMSIDNFEYTKVRLERGVMQILVLLRSRGIKTLLSQQLHWH